MSLNTQSLKEQLNSLDTASIAVVSAVVNMYLNGQKQEADAFIKALLAVTK